MVVVGVLAAIAVPAFLTQKGRAGEASVKSDVKNIGQEVLSFYVGGTGALTLVAGSTTWELRSGTTTVATGRLSNGNRLSPTSSITSDDSYCVAVVPSQVGAQTWRASGTGLAKGAC